MIQDLAIFGAGGLGRELALLVQQVNTISLKWNLKGFYDDHRKDDLIDLLPVLGDIGVLKKNSERISLLIGIADPATRKRIYGELKSTAMDFPVFTHPSGQTGSAGNQFGKGTILCAGCILTTGITLGEFVVVNLSCTIGHDVRVGNFTSIMPSVNISGNVSIGEGVLIGSGATILQGLTIGDGAIIGAGAVVTKSVPANTTVIGVPARKMIK